MSSFKEKTPSSLERKTDDFIWGTLAFVLGNLYGPPLLKKIADSGEVRSFKIGPRSWELEVKNDIDTRNSEPIRIITLTTTDSKTRQIEIYGLLTNGPIEKIIGIYRRRGKDELGFSIPPVDFSEMTQEVRQAEREKVLRSFWQTRSISWTARKQDLRYERVRRITRHTRKHPHRH